MPMTSHRKKLEATARALHSDDLIDADAETNSDVLSIQETRDWVKEAIQEAEQQLEASRQMNLFLGELLEQIDTIKPERELPTKQPQDTIHVTTIRIPLKLNKTSRKLARVA